MGEFETSKIVVPHSGRCQDFVAIREFDAGVVIVIADGAGGSGSGEVAARTVADTVMREASLDHDAAAWCFLLQQIDHSIAAGESTCVGFSVSKDRVVGASVGDSQLWHVKDEQIQNLTSSQIRKPLLGSGDARPVGFTHSDTSGLLLGSTDGFCNYIRKDRFLREYLWHEFSVLPRKLVELVRLPSGQLWDDIGIVACKRRMFRQARQRYSFDESRDR